MKQSAGVLPFRQINGNLEFFLVHPGGPFWKNKDAGAWSISKGEYDSSESPLDAAQREFKEETGVGIVGKFIALGQVKQKAGKIVFCWAVEADFNPDEIVSNEVSIMWPPKSGRSITFPEVDKAGWFASENALKKINPSQIAFLERLKEYLGNEERGERNCKEGL